MSTLASAPLPHRRLPVPLERAPGHLASDDGVEALVLRKAVAVAIPRRTRTVEGKAVEVRVPERIRTVKVRRERTGRVLLRIRVKPRRRRDYA